MFEARVGGARVNVVAPAELFDPTQSLKVGAIDDAVFGPGEGREAVDAVED